MSFSTKVSQCLGVLLYRRHYAMLVFIIISVLDVVTGEIEVGECVHRYEERSNFIVGVQVHLHCAITNIDDMADKISLFTIDDLDPVSDLDRVLGETECH